MTDIAKFLTDAKKILKFDRQNNSGKSDFDRIENNLRSLFDRSTSCPGQLPNTVFAYWVSEYVATSADMKAEPSDENLDRLAAMLAFLENSDEGQEVLTDDDWQEIGELVNVEAEDLPINVLQDLMSILVSKGAY